MDMDKTNKATPPTRADARSQDASPTSAAFFSATGSCSRPQSAARAPFSASRSRLRSSAAPFSASRPRPTVRSALLFSASRSRPRPAHPSLRADVDYSKHDAKKMKELRLVPEEEWFPHQRQERRLTGARFWTVVQKDLYLALKKPVSEMRWVDWALVDKSTGPDVRRYFAATPGLDMLLERRDLRWADSLIRQFYATLWVHPDRSMIKFMLGNKQRELSRDDFAKHLGLSAGGARVHSLAYPNGKRGEDHWPPLESIRHLYNNPDAVVEHWKDRNQWNHETAAVHAIMRISIRPISSGGLDSLTTLDIWILHLLMSAKPIDVVDLMIGEMQEVILKIKHRKLPYAPYLVHLFDKNGWLEHGMKNELDQRLKRYTPYKPLKPDDRRRLKKPAQSSNAPKPDGKRSVGSRSSLPPQVEAGFDHENAPFDHMLSPSLEEHSLGKTTNGFRLSQQGAHDDAEAGSSGGHAHDDPPMLHVDRQPVNLEQLQGQLTELQRQCESHRQQMQEQRESDRQQMEEQRERDRQQMQEQRERDRQQMQEQRESDRQQMQEQRERELQQIQGQHDRDLKQIQRQLAELQLQSESHRQENRDLRKQIETDRQENRDLRKQYSDIAALLDGELDAIVSNDAL